MWCVRVRACVWLCIWERKRGEDKEKLSLTQYQYHFIYTFKHLSRNCLVCKTLNYLNTRQTAETDTRPTTDRTKNYITPTAQNQSVRGWCGSLLIGYCWCFSSRIELFFSLYKKEMYRDNIRPYACRPLHKNKDIVVVDITQVDDITHENKKLVALDSCSYKNHICQACHHIQ